MRISVREHFGRRKFLPSKGGALRLKQQSGFSLPANLTSGHSGELPLEPSFNAAAQSAVIGGGMQREKSLFIAH
jgi:hypothetical protein